MTILIELSLFLNFIINFFIIKCTSKVVCFKSKLAIFASLLGGIVAVVMPLFKVTAFATIAIQLLLSFAICLICFPCKPIKKFAVGYAVFLGFTFLFGGACLALQNVFGDLSLFCIFAISFAVYVVCAMVLKYQGRIKRVRQFSYKVQLYCDDKMVEEEGFLDSGNILYDPITKLPIILISFDIFSKLKPEINYISAYCKQVDTKLLENGHYVKINTVASGTSILVFTVDKVEIFEGEQVRDYKNMAVGLSFSGFEKALGKKILLHREFA